MNKERFLHLHFSHALRGLVDLGQEIDRHWGQEGHKERLKELKNFLHLSSQHPSQEVAQLSRHERLIQADMSQEQFLTLLIPIERAHSRGVVDHDFLIDEGDADKSQVIKTIPSIIILDNMRSAFNLGSAFRTAECFAIDRMILTGYTPMADNPKTIKTAMGTSGLVPWTYAKHCHEAIQELKSEGYQVLAVETVAGSQSLYQKNIDAKTAFVFGNERHGLSPSTIAECDDAVHIPLYGRKNSLNVGVCLGVVLSECRRQLSL